MYYNKIEPAAVVDLRERKAIDAAPDAKTALFGLHILLVGLPLLVARLFLWGVARDIRRIVKLGGVVGHAFTEALRDR